MRNPDKVATRLTELKQLGLRLAIDDFGTGYSSLAYLRQFPVDIAQDRPFVHHRPRRLAAKRRRWCTRWFSSARTSNLDTSPKASSTTTSSQLQDEACDNGQGFIFARPLKIQAATRFLAARAGQSRKACCPPARQQFPSLLGRGGRMGLSSHGGFRSVLSEQTCGHIAASGLVVRAAWRVGVAEGLTEGKLSGPDTVATPADRLDAWSRRDRAQLRASLEALLRRLIETAVELTGARYGALGVIDQLGTARAVHHGRDRRRDAGDDRRAAARAGHPRVLIRERRPYAWRLGEDPRSVGSRRAIRRWRRSSACRSRCEEPRSGTSI